MLVVQALRLVDNKVLSINRNKCGKRWKSVCTEVSKNNKRNKNEFLTKCSFLLFIYFLSYLTNIQIYIGIIINYICTCIEKTMYYKFIVICT